MRIFLSSRACLKILIIMMIHMSHCDMDSLGGIKIHATAKHKKLIQNL